MGSEWDRPHFLCWASLFTRGVFRYLGEELSHAVRRASYTGAEELLVGLLASSRPGVKDEFASVGVISGKAAGSLCFPQFRGWAQLSITAASQWGGPCAELLGYLGLWGLCAPLCVLASPCSQPALVLGVAWSPSYPEC